MKKILIAIIAIALIGGAVVFYKVSERNASNKKQVFKIQYYGMCEQYLKNEIVAGNLTKENVHDICNCVLEKETININADKPPGNMKEQLTECQKELNLKK